MVEVRSYSIRNDDSFLGFLKRGLREYGKSLLFKKIGNLESKTKAECMCEGTYLIFLSTLTASVLSLLLDKMTYAVLINLNSIYDLIVLILVKLGTFLAVYFFLILIYVALNTLFYEYFLRSVMQNINTGEIFFTLSKSIAHFFIFEFGTLLTYLDLSHKYEIYHFVCCSAIALITNYNISYRSRWAKKMSDKQKCISLLYLITSTDLILFFLFIFPVLAFFC